jgi:hypothetical protein
VTVPGPTAYNGAVIRVLLAALTVLAASPAASAGRQPLVSYARTGGFIGVQDSLKVLESGAARSTNGDFRLSSKRLATLQARLRAAGFPTLRRKYASEHPVSDGFVYRVTYAGRTVVVEEDANAPLRLQRVLDLLADILARQA